MLQFILGDEFIYNVLIYFTLNSIVLHKGLRRDRSKSQGENIKVLNWQMLEFKTVLRVLKGCTKKVLLVVMNKKEAIQLA